MLSERSSIKSSGQGGLNQNDYIDDASRGGWGVWDLNDDDDDGTISSKNKKAAAMIYHPLLMIFLMKVTLYISTN